VTKLSAKAALREWRAGWRRFFRAGAAPGGGGGGGGVDRRAVEPDAGLVDAGPVDGGEAGGDMGAKVGGREADAVVWGVRAVTRWSRAARSASICLRMSGSLSICPLSQATL
jgi:hypothetical protein